MPDCNYCEESFADEEAYLDHLHEAHDEGELSRIDRRRVESHVGDEGGGFPTGPVIIVGLLLFAFGVLGYATFVVWDDTGVGESGGVGQTPTNLGSVHEHGTINVSINGEQVDFSQQQYQVEDDFFHFENGNGDVWHVHGQGVTLEYAMNTLGIGVSSSSVTHDGETYQDSEPGTNVTVAVDGEPVDPKSYELQGTESNTGDDGDHIRIVVTTDDTA